jgi:hypothetical protein
MKLFFFKFLWKCLLRSCPEGSNRSIVYCFNDRCWNNDDIWR